MPIKTKLAIDIPAREKFKQRIRLLSGGFVNPKAFPNGEITIYPWDIQVDDWMLTQGKNQGSNMFDIVPNLCDLNGADVNELFVGDASTILLVSRSLRHGNTIEFSPVCSFCNRTNKPESLKIPDQLRKLAEKPPGWGGTDKVTLPDSGDEVEIRPLRVGDEKAIDALKFDEAKELPSMTAHIIWGIVSIGGGKPDTRGELLHWFRALSPKDQDYLGSKVDELHPRLDNDVDYRCDFCGKIFTYTIEFNRNFFRGGVV